MNYGGVPSTVKASDVIEGAQGPLHRLTGDFWTG